MKDEGNKTEKISVRVNGKLVELYRGLKVKHALIALDQELYRAARRGDLIVQDTEGHFIGLDGALCEGYAINTKAPK